MTIIWDGDLPIRGLDFPQTERLSSVARSSRTRVVYGEMFHLSSQWQLFPDQTWCGPGPRSDYQQGYLYHDEHRIDGR